MNCEIARITPAYAGKRFRGQRGSKVYKDHPRLCGEKYVPGTRQSLAVGSPPPMRGKDSLEIVGTLYDRITPAYAGKRPSSHVKAPSSQDHPRLCGEKFANDTQMAAYAGITPAYAGKS